jgi:hypothetical protein
MTLSFLIGYSIMTFESFVLSLWFTQIFLFPWEFASRYYVCMLNGDDGISSISLDNLFDTVAYIRAIHG